MTLELDRDPEPGTEGNGEGSESEANVPSWRLREETEKRQRLERELEELRAKAPSDAPKRLSRTDLQAAVESGKLTETQATEIWERQTREEIEADLLKKVEQRIGEGQTEAQALATIQRYREAVPEVMTEGSDIRKKVHSQFRLLVEEFGQPQTQAQLHKMEAVALKSALGSPERLKVTETRETFQETGGGGQDEAPKEKGWPSDMPKRTRDYYQGLIDQGMYSDIEAVRKEWNSYGYKDVAKRAAAR